MSGRPHWPTDGRDWPNRGTSRFLGVGGLGWHVQVAGEGPVLLLVHGTGAATHSWRGLLPLLARRFTVVAPDLPGHGFTDFPRDGRLSLPAMARALSRLLQALQLSPVVAVGHSAGAAVIARMTLDGGIAPRVLVGINAALQPFDGVAAPIFQPLARLLSGLPGVSSLFAWQAADRGVVERLLRGTGSAPDATGVDLYHRLLRRPGHIRGALGMMAAWELAPLLRDLRRLAVPLVLVVGAGDRTVPPAQARALARRLPGVRVEELPGLGHLAHEEAPEALAQLIGRIADAHGGDAA